MTANNWDSDEIILKNELKLIDDSYYRVYDDNDYEIWRERMFSLIENQCKIKASIAAGDEEKINSSASNSVAISMGEGESTINEVNPIKPVILDLPNETIYKGIEPKPPNIENYNLNVSWGMKYLLGDIDQKFPDPSQQTKFKSILLESKPGRSKWSNPNRAGLDELYQGLEKVLLDLKSYTPYSIPFLVKVSKKDVPDYYNVIKRPMDLGTMGKKLKAQEYNNKQQFIDDLNLIYTNCFTYNTAEDSIYRQHIQMLRDKWTYLLKSVPDIIMGKSTAASSEPIFDKKEKVIKAQPQEPLNVPKTPTKVTVESDPMFDDLDDLLNAHLDSLSDTESCPSPKKQRKTSTLSTTTSTTTYEPPIIHFNNLSDKFPKRCDRIMVKYGKDCKAAWGKRSGNESTENGASFVFPELVYFFNSVPDAHLIKQDKKSNIFKQNYSSVNTMNRFYENFRILQAIRSLRKHLLEGSRAEVPSIEYIKTPSQRFDRFGNIFGDVIEHSWRAKVILRKVIALYLGQAGFELVSNSALHAFYEFVDWQLTKIFEALKLLNEQFGREKDSADILRLALLQLNLKHLSDLDVVMTEDSYAKGRLEHLLSVMCGKVQEYQSNLRATDEANPEESRDNDENSSELDEDDDGVEEDNEDPEEDEDEIKQSTENEEEDEEDDEEIDEE